jgi:hypothetical protein
MKLLKDIPSGVRGIICALVAFLAVGIPLYSRGWSFWPCLGIQVAVMAALVFIWTGIEARIKSREVNTLKQNDTGFIEAK